MVENLVLDEAFGDPAQKGVGAIRPGNEALDVTRTTAGEWVVTGRRVENGVAAEAFASILSADGRPTGNPDILFSDSFVFIDIVVDGIQVAVPRRTRDVTIGPVLVDGDDVYLVENATEQHWPDASTRIVTGLSATLWRVQRSAPQNRQVLGLIRTNSFQEGPPHVSEINGDQLEGWALVSSIGGPTERVRFAPGQAPEVTLFANDHLIARSLGNSGDSDPASVYLYSTPEGLALRWPATGSERALSGTVGMATASLLRVGEVVLVQTVSAVYATTRQGSIVQLAAPEPTMRLTGLAATRNGIQVSGYYESPSIPIVYDSPFVWVVNRNAESIYTSGRHPGGRFAGPVNDVGSGRLVLATYTSASSGECVAFVTHGMTTPGPLRRMPGGLRREPLLGMLRNAWSRRAARQVGNSVGGGLASIRRRVWPG